MDKDLKTSIEDLVLKNTDGCVKDENDNIYVPLSETTKLMSMLLMSQVILCDILKDGQEISLDNERYDKIIEDILNERISFEINEKSNSLIFCEQNK